MRNKFLYSKLQAMFGRPPHICRAGSEEEDYRVNCPYCGDTKNRLYISCKWGVYNPIEGHSNVHLITCYNERCVNPGGVDDITAEERKERRHELFLQVYRGVRSSTLLAPATKAKESLKEPLEWPGKVIRFDKLFTKKPDHPAVVYMQKRGYDPVQLGKEYGFVFCDKVTDPRYAMALGTILMPIYHKGNLYSWTSRAIGDDVVKKKYYNCPGRPQQTIGYRLDVALRYSTIVIVEGILDCIKVGPFATCLFTKTLNVELKKKIVKGLQKYGDDAVAIVMLDPDQSEKERQKGTKHPIEVVADALAEYVPHVLRVYLPTGNIGSIHYGTQ
jgi:hypothetical protein